MPPRLGDAARSSPQRHKEHKENNSANQRCRIMLSLLFVSLCSLCLCGEPSLRDQLFADLALADDVDGPITRSHQFLLAVDAELMVDGHGQVFDGERIILRLGRGGVGSAVDMALLDAAAGQDNAEDLGPM